MAVTGLVFPEKRIRLGDCELNAAAFELRRGRRIIKLERIPLRVLLMLIEERGNLVTRESIAERVWGSGVFVDVDNGINTAIRKIRQVLNDDPQRPRFIETISGMGYRFIGPVEPITEAAAGQIAKEAPAPLELVETEQNSNPETARSLWTRIAVVIEDRAAACDFAHLGDGLQGDKKAFAPDSTGIERRCDSRGLGDQGER
jgi:DNA-binding winged helix-turn-helix (wHTH) protein